MVQSGHHDLVAGTPVLGQVPGEVIGELGGTATIDDAGRVRSQQVGVRAAECGHRLLSVALRDRLDSTVGQWGGQRLRDRFAHLSRGLSAAGGVEERDAGVQGRKMTAECGQIES